MRIDTVHAKRHVCFSHLKALWGYTQLVTMVLFMSSFTHCPTWQRGHTLSLQRPSRLQCSLLPLCPYREACSCLPGSLCRPPTGLPLYPPTDRPFSALIKDQDLRHQHHRNRLYGWLEDTGLHIRLNFRRLVKGNRETRAEVHKKIVCKVILISEPLSGGRNIQDDTFITRYYRSNKVFQHRTQRRKLTFSNTLGWWKHAKGLQIVKNLWRGEKPRWECCFGKFAPVTWDPGMDSHLEGPFTFSSSCFSVDVRACVCASAGSWVWRCDPMFSMCAWRSSQVILFWWQQIDHPYAWKHYYQWCRCNVSPLSSGITLAGVVTRELLLLTFDFPLFYPLLKNSSSLNYRDYPHPLLFWLQLTPSAPRLDRLPLIPLINEIEHNKGKSLGSWWADQQSWISAGSKTVSGHFV